MEGVGRPQHPSWEGTVVLGWWVGGVRAPLHCPPGAPSLSGPQVLLVQFKGTGKYYAVKALKKQEVLSRDEMERCVATPAREHVAWRGPGTAGLGSWRREVPGASMW